MRKRDYHEPLLDGVHIFLNPHAETPLPASIFNWPAVEYHSMGKDGIPIGDPIDGNIHSRFTRTLSRDEPEAKVDEYIAKVNKYAEEEMAKDLAREAEQD